MKRQKLSRGQTPKRFNVIPLNTDQNRGTYWLVENSAIQIFDTHKKQENGQD
jgi:hypothetical protein